MWLYFTVPYSTPINIRFPVANITDVSFVVQWDAVINQSVDRYIVNWTDGTNSIQTVTVNETSYNITGLSPNIIYTVTVAAVNKCGTGPFSGNKTVTTSAYIIFNMDTSAASTTSISYSIGVDPTATTTFIVIYSMNTAVNTVTYTDTTATTTNNVTNSITMNTAVNTVTYTDTTVTTTNNVTNSITMNTAVNTVTYTTTSKFSSTWMNNCH